MKNIKALYKTKYVLILIIIVAGIFLFYQNTTNKPNTATQNNTHANIIANNAPLEIEDEKITEEWDRRINEVGAQQAYEDFKNYYKDVGFGPQHSAAHVMGELLYEHGGIDGITICDASFAFGCYHSFFGIALSEHGTEIVQEMDKVCVNRYGEFGTGCLHGIGHGIVEYMGHNQLVKSLETCLLTTQKRELFGCTSGVFMEYNLPIIIEGSNIYTEVRPFPGVERAQEPCNTIVPEQFRKSCYYEIGQWWKNGYSSDFEKLGVLCQQIKQEEYRDICFLGLGKVAAPTHNFDIDLTIESCDQMPNPHGSLMCRAGASWTFFSVPEVNHLSIKLCEGLQNTSEHACVEEADLLGNQKYLSDDEK